MINLSITKRIAEELGLKDWQVYNTITLILNEECTIPFIARYRKEKTGSLNEVIIRDIRDRYLYSLELDSLKKKYIKTIEELSLKNPDLQKRFPDIAKKITEATSKQEVEDLYLPFRPKRRTRAQIAKEKGLAILATKILENKSSIISLEEVAKAFITPSDSKKEEHLKVLSVDDAIKGASDIICEDIGENAEYRAIVREFYNTFGYIVASKIENLPDGINNDPNDEKYKAWQQKLNKYQNYFNYREHVKKAVPHRIMAIRRGETEGVLKTKIEVDNEEIIKKLKSIIVNPEHNITTVVKNFLYECVENAYKRFIAPAIETEIRVNLKNYAESEAIKVFAKNLESLLMLPPIPNNVVLGVDPGYRTGSKLAVVSQTGGYITHAIIYPNFKDASDPKTQEAKKILLDLIETHKVTYIAIGNGTGCKEISTIIRDILQDNKLQHVKKVYVNEAGASIYSTDQVAREEFKDLDPTIRSAISIARRLQDPLAELVKIDPRSIGVGQYQHDVNVNKLKRHLEEVVESCVNRVGVNLNTASSQLLSYVSGIGPALAKNIVSYRDTNGPFKNRIELLQVSGFGPKVFQQSAGFLRITDGDNILDSTGIHPEHYEVVEKIAKDLGKTIKEIVGIKELIEALPLERYISANIGKASLEDIAKELIKPGRDPREEGSRLVFSEEFTSIEQLKPGMELQGTVTNVTDFGAFVDIGVHQDGLVHLSELADEYIKDPLLVVSVGNILNVKIIDIDLQRKRIYLTCRKDDKAKERLNAILNKEKNWHQENSNKNKIFKKRPELLNKIFTKPKGLKFNNKNTNKDITKNIIKDDNYKSQSHTATANSKELRQTKSHKDIRDSHVNKHKDKHHKKPLNSRSKFNKSDYKKSHHSKDSKEYQSKYTIDDLLKKFNQNKLK